MPKKTKRKPKNKNFYYKIAIAIIIMLFILFYFKIGKYLILNYYLHLSPEYSDYPYAKPFSIIFPTPSPPSLFASPSPSSPQINSCAYDPVQKKCLGTCATQGECCDPEKNYDDCSTKESCKCHKPCSDDKDCMICTVASEALGQSDACQKAVAQIIKNRKELGSKNGYKDTVCEVVKQPKQFSGVRDCSTCAEEPKDIFCKCCRNRKFEGADQKAMANICKIEKDTEAKIDPAPKLSINQAKATHFNNAGMNSWARRNCQKINYPDCKAFDFYKC